MQQKKVVLFLHNNLFLVSVLTNGMRRIEPEIQSICFVEPLRAIFSKKQESKDSQEISIFLLFRQNIPLGELIQGKIL